LNIWKEGNKETVCGKMGQWGCSFYASICEIFSSLTGESARKW